MKRFMVTYQIKFTVRVDSEDEVKEEARRKIIAYLDEPDDLRTLLQTTVMDTEPIIEEIKEK